jgi:hypothetical protein
MSFFLVESFRSDAPREASGSFVGIFLTQIAAEDFLARHRTSSRDAVNTLEPIELLAKLLCLNESGVKTFRIVGLDGSLDSEASTMVYHDPQRAFERACFELAKINDATLSVT